MKSDVFQSQLAIFSIFRHVRSYENITLFYINYLEICLYESYKIVLIIECDEHLKI
jgi:hypothetical protein